ncbi:MAG: Spo0E family sporulation regulatory protein-aspartic acid phosphatase [Clostridia bacterium]|nr:Spo0E family sporulation regulatory protein-aspartic acid phosphatase [Clostridia bacterium]
MSKELMHVLITKMHFKLNRLIEKSSYNLLNSEVQHYSQRLDKVLTHYNKKTEKSAKFNAMFYKVHQA